MSRCTPFERFARTAAVASLWASLVTAGGAAAESVAQPGIKLTGVAVHLGLAVPNNADVAFAYGGRLALGGPSPAVRIGAGISSWTADIDRSELGAGDTSGSISDFAFDVDARVMPLRVKMVRPYLAGGLALHLVSADIGDDPSLEDALSSTNVGIDLGIGVESQRAGLGWGAEFKRRFVSDIDHWSLMVAGRWTFGG